MSAEHIIEKQLTLKQLNTIAYEGFNKLYGLHADDKNSFWQNDISPIVVESNNQLLINEHKELSIELEKHKKEIKNHEEQRQLSVHYSKGIISVYDMLYNLKPEKELHKANSLLNVLPKVIKHCENCLAYVGLKNQEYQNTNMSPTYEKIDSIVDKLKKQPQNERKPSVNSVYSH